MESVVVRARDASGLERLRVCFVMLQALGHVTETKNIRSAMAGLGAVLDAHWLETTNYSARGRLERVPGVPGFLRSGMRGLIELRAELRRAPADVLVFNPQNAAMLCQWYMRRIPTVLMTDATPIQHDAMAELYRHAPDRNPAVRMLKHRVNVLNYHLAEAVVAFCSWVRDSLITDYGLSPQSTHVLCPGVDTARWRPAERRPARGRVRVLFVGADFERKGGRLLCETFRNREMHRVAELHVVTRDDVPAMPGVVVHRGLLPNSAALIELYQSADVFALPTLADCFPNAALEAAAAGLPIVTSDIAGLPDIVDHGRNGFLLPPGDGHAVGEAVEALIADAGLRARHGASSRQRALDRFDSRPNAARLLMIARDAYAARRRIASQV